MAALHGGSPNGFHESSEKIRTMCQNKRLNGEIVSMKDLTIVMER